MFVQTLYYVFLCLMLVAGVVCIRKSIQTTGRQKFQFNARYYRNSASRWVQKNLKGIGEDPFEQAGLKVTVGQYNLLRFAVSAGIAGVYAPQGDLMGLLAAILLLVLSVPESTILGFKSPFTYIIQSLVKRKGERIDDEIYKLSIQLENLSVIQREKPSGADYIIEQMMRHAKELKGILAECLSLYRLGREDDAHHVFSRRCGTKFSRDFAGILFKLDQVNPSELTEQLLLFSSSMQEDKMTRQLNKANNRSVILMMMTTVTVLVMFSNIMAIIFMDNASLTTMF